jgi:hypothetical protein
MEIHWLGFPIAEKEDKELFHWIKNATMITLTMPKELCLQISNLPIVSTILEQKLTDI